MRHSRHSSLKGVPALGPRKLKTSKKTFEAKLFALACFAESERADRATDVRMLRIMF